MSARRTEPPTPRRLRQARREGDVATSRELTGAAALLAAVATLYFTGGAVVRLLADGVASGLGLAFSDVEPWAAVRGALLLLARAALPPMLAAASAALATGAAQTGGLVAPAALRFRPGRLDPARGLARLASAEGAVRAAGGVARAALVVAVACGAGAGSGAALATAPRLDAPRLVTLGARTALPLLGGGAAVLAALGAVDLALARWHRRRRLAMTRDEVVREQRQDQGDPRRRSERRRLHRALASAAPLRDATCLVVNPTHVAVALLHRDGSDDAPVVVAKGIGDDAALLRRQARRMGLPVVHDIALARGLYRLADVGEEIPLELYDAAAAVLVHVHAGTYQESMP